MGRDDLDAVLIATLLGISRAHGRVRDEGPANTPRWKCRWR